MLLYHHNDDFNDDNVEDDVVVLLYSHSDFDAILCYISFAIHPRGFI